MDKTLFLVQLLPLEEDLVVEEMVQAQVRQTLLVKMVALVAVVALLNQTVEVLEFRVKETMVLLET
jgi:hypothetical protein